MEYIKLLLDIAINSSALSVNSRVDQHIQKLIDLNPFNILLKHFFEYEFNNVFQKLYEKIVVLITNQRTPTNLIDVFFIKSKFFEKFTNFTMDKFTFKYKYQKNSHYLIFHKFNMIIIFYCLKLIFNPKLRKIN